MIRYGHSRDQQSDAKPINLLADVTHPSRVPVGYQALAGNTADITTPPRHLDAWLRFLARPELALLNLHPILVTQVFEHIHDSHYLGTKIDAVGCAA